MQCHQRSARTRSFITVTSIRVIKLNNYENMHAPAHTDTPLTCWAARAVPTFTRTIQFQSYKYATWEVFPRSWFFCLTVDGPHLSNATDASSWRVGDNLFVWSARYPSQLSYWTPSKTTGRFLSFSVFAPLEYFQRRNDKFWETNWWEHVLAT